MVFTHILVNSVLNSNSKQLFPFDSNNRLIRLSGCYTAVLSCFLNFFKEIKLISLKKFNKQESTAVSTKKILPSRRTDSF